MVSWEQRNSMSDQQMHKNNFHLYRFRYIKMLKIKMKFCGAVTQFRKFGQVDALESQGVEKPWYRV